MLQRRLFFLLITISIVFSASAQLRIGLKGGFSTTDVDAKDFRVTDPGGIDQLGIALKEARYGIHGGLVLRAQINKFLIQPEVLFNSNRVDYLVTDLNTQVSGIFSEKFQYLDIPVLVGFKFGPLRLMGGPQGHVYINNSSDLIDFQNYEQTFKDVTLSWMGGVGLDIWNLMLDVRYEGGLTNFGDHINFFNTRYDFANRPSRWLFSAGFLFGGK